MATIAVRPTGFIAVFIVFLVLFVTGCGFHSEEWVLTSYDKETGYVFTKNRAEYQATCFATGYPVLDLAGQQPDLSPDALPPGLARSEEDCGDILVYLRKPVPGLKEVNGSLLLYIGEKNYRIEFEIKHAK